MQQSSWNQTNFSEVVEVEESHDNFRAYEIFAFSEKSNILYEAYGEPTCLNGGLMLR